MIMDRIEIWVAKAMIYFIKKGYGCDCPTRDLDDWPELSENSVARCASCRAREVVEWLESHISLIEEFRC